MRRTFLPLFLIICGSLWAQDFGFGFDDDSESSSGSKPVSFKVGGEVFVEATPYVYEFLDEDKYSDISIWNTRLDMSLLSKHVDIITSFNFNEGSINELWSGSSNLFKSNYTPLIIDEAFVRAYIGLVNIEAGYRKLTWGKADSGGPLDVTNPIDYSDLRNIDDLRANKIARPMVHLTVNTGALSKLEGVFIPNFTGHRFAESGRWVPGQIKNMAETMASVENEITGKFFNEFGAMLFDPTMASIFIPIITKLKEDMLAHPYDITFPSTDSIEYFQAGLRYTLTIGSADIGAQYYYGTFFRPSFTITGIDEFVDDFAKGLKGANPPDTLNPDYQCNPSIISPLIKYNRYHQVGLDYAQILAGFNIRAEAAIFITEDLKGDDGSVQNPFIGWSLGFDRDLFAGINLNVQCNETIRLFNDKIGDNPIFDAEAGTDVTSTRLSVQLSRKFLRDNLETKATVIWDIENSDCYIIPAIIYTAGNMSTELSAGIFAGDTDGELGQYWENSFIKLGVKFSF